MLGADVVAHTKCPDCHMLAYLHHVLGADTGTNTSGTQGCGSKSSSESQKQNKERERNLLGQRTEYVKVRNFIYKKIGSLGQPTGWMKDRLVGTGSL